MKNEVRSLEQAVCDLVTKLDLLLTTRGGIQILKASNGLHISTPNHLSEQHDAFVTIIPVGWPKGSFIQARFFKSVRRWKLYEGGQIWAQHLEVPICGLSFKPANNVMGIVLDPSDYVEQGTVICGYRHLIESLEEDATELK